MSASTRSHFFAISLAACVAAACGPGNELALEEETATAADDGFPPDTSAHDSLQPSDSAFEQLEGTAGLSAAAPGQPRVKCVTRSDGAHSSGQPVIDGFVIIRGVPFPIFRDLRIESDTIYKYCWNPDQPSHDWIKLESIFGTFSAGKVPLVCSTFDKIKLYPSYVDGRGTKIVLPELAIECNSGARGSSNWRDVSAKWPRLYPVNRFGWPKVTVRVKAVHRGAPDKWLGTLRYRLNPIIIGG